MPCGDLIYLKLRDEIISGCFGESGSAFMQIRQLTAEYHISTVRAQNIIRALVKDRLLVLCGKHYFVSTGTFSTDSPGYQNLRRANFPLIGIGVGSFVPIYSALIENLTALASDAGYQTVCMYENDRLSEMLDSMLAIGVHGMFFLPKHLKSHILLDRFVLPTVVIGKSIDGIKCDTITMDNYQAGILAADHLLYIHCKSCCYIGHAHNYGNDQRYSGFETRIRSSGVTLTSILAESPSDERLRGYLRQTLPNFLVRSEFSVIPIFLPWKFFVRSGHSGGAYRRKYVLSVVITSHRRLRIHRR